MNTQHLEPQNEPQAETYHPEPASENATEETSFAANRAEILETLEQMKAREEAAVTRTYLRNLLQAQTKKTPDAYHLMQLPFDEVLAIVREESRKRAKRQKLFVGLYLSIVALLVVAAIATHKTTFLTTMGSWVSFIAIGAAASQRQKAASLAMAQFDDVRAVGPLAETLEFKDKDLVRVTEQALIGLLPRMKASDASLLNPDQRHSLNRALRGKNVELILAILKAWEQVGDAKAIEEVEKLTRGRGGSGWSSRVVVAAQECLPFLRQSAERQQIGSQLLRPADGNLTPSDVLLRPAMPHASTEPSGELLRPTNNVF